MNLNSPKKTSEVFSQYWPWFFFAAAFESLVAILALLLIPSERGLSLARMALLAILLFFSLIGMYWGIAARRNLTRFDKFARPPVIYICALLFLTSSLLLFLLRYLNFERLQPYYDRLSPLLWYFIAIGFQSVIFLLLVKNGFYPQEISKRKSVYLSALAAFCVLLSVFLFVVITKIGLIPDTGYWGEPGVAIQGWQFVLAIFAGFITLLATSRIPNPKSQIPALSKALPRACRRVEGTTYIIPLALYIIALILWLGVPVDVLQNSFYAPISPPANVPFPYSDAGFYDYLSQSLLIGTGYFGGIPPRPLYVVFLALLHFIFGQNYPAVIAVQTFVLALFPVALYFLAKKLHTPAAGVTVALFAIFRELVGLWISSNTRVANSKMFTTDFPTAMGIAFMCLVAIWWLERRDFKSTLVAGGAFGLLSLFRTQSLLILPVLFILTWFAYQRKTKEWILAGAAFAVMMALTVLPWLTHNYTIAGQFSFDDPNQVAIIYSQYSFTGNLDLSQFDPEKESAGQRILSFTLENPAYVAKFITTHFLNTEIGGLLALPLIKGFDGLFAPVNLYWISWDGSLEWYNLALILFYLGVLAVGFGAAWYRLKWIALAPLAFNLGYALANGISRFSSWRYNLPVDWVIYFYFAIGIIEILGGLAFLLGAKPTILVSTTLESDSSLSDKRNISNVFARRAFAFPDEARAASMPARGIVSPRRHGDASGTPALAGGARAEQERPRNDTLRVRIIPILLAFIFIGALPWLAKGLAQPRYTSSQDDLIAKLESNGFDREEIQSFLLQPNSAIMEGRLLYPRMYSRNEGLASANPWPAYAEKDFPRIGFILINDNAHHLIFPTKTLLDFPQGADAILLACEIDGVLEVRVIDFGDKSFQSAPLSQPCN